jgi:ElaB/YqjD/DUF883 family membrane-anchored ribosome-binding protein
METQTQSSAPDVADDPLAAAKERLGPRLDEAREQLDALNLRVQTYVKENPGKALLGALAVGFAVGRLVSKK